MPPAPGGWVGVGAVGCWTVVGQLLVVGADVCLLGCFLGRLLVQLFVVSSDLGVIGPILGAP